MVVWSAVVGLVACWLLAVGCQVLDRIHETNKMKKRSKYKPKGVRLDVMAWVQSGMKLVSQVEHGGVNLKIKNHAALVNITQGKGTRADLDVIIDAMNVAEALALLGKGKDWHPEIREAQDCIFNMGRRGVEKDDRFVLYGTEMKAINLAMDVHDAQLDECTVKELEEALDFVHKQIKHKRARAIVLKAA